MLSQFWLENNIMKQGNTMSRKVYFFSCDFSRKKCNGYVDNTSFEPQSQLIKNRLFNALCLTDLSTVQVQGSSISQKTAQADDRLKSCLEIDE